MEQLLTWFLLLFSSLVAGNYKEHRVPYVQNIVLYPDKHSWCKTTEIKQIVAYPGCSSVEVDNNVCVGACFSYSIPKTVPSAPGEVIVPYCDSCQPTNVTWKEVTLTCSSDSEENGGSIELTKRVQIINNCSCAACNKQYEASKNHELHKKHEVFQSDVPELMQLMMEVHNTRSHDKMKLMVGEDDEGNEGKDNEKTEKVPLMESLEMLENASQNKKEIGLPVMTSSEDDDIKISDNETDENEKFKIILKNEEKLLLEKKENLELQKKKAMQKIEEKLQSVFTGHHVKPGEKDVGHLKEHFILGPHHSLVIKEEVDVKPLKTFHRKPVDDEVIPSLLENQFKIHDKEEIPDQLAVESTHREKEIFNVPEMIYHRVGLNDSVENKDGGGDDEKWSSGGGELMVDIDHRHLKPAVEGAEVSYVVPDKKSN